MSTVEETIEVDVPVRTAYDQWTQFEEFPRFMEGVERVVQLDDTHLHWVAKIAGKEKEWDAEIVDQVPDQQIAWRNYDGAGNKGVVTFRELDADHSEVRLRMDLEPDGVVEGVGDMLGFTDRRVKGDLKRFKEFIEERGQATGAWRGDV